MNTRIPLEVPTDQLDATPIPSRLVLIESIYHVAEQNIPTEVNSKYESHLDTDELPYQKILATVGTEWEKVDTGWLDEVSLLHIENHSRESDKVVELAYKYDEVWLINPKESFRGCPSKPRDLFIRCQSGEAKYTLTAFPR